MLLAALESPQLVGVHQGGLVVHRPTQQDLLNIEQNFQRKLKKIKSKSYLLDLRWWRFWILSHFHHWK
jgi:hypothetical protein